MGVSINATIGFGLVIPDRDWTLTYEDGEEYNGGAGEYMEEVLSSYKHLSYSISYYYEMYDVDPAVYINSTVQDFYWVGPHTVELGVTISEEEEAELRALAERLDVPFEPEWLLSIRVA